LETPTAEGVALDSSEPLRTPAAGCCAAGAPECAPFSAPVARSKWASRVRRWCWAAISGLCPSQPATLSKRAASSQGTEVHTPWASDKILWLELEFSAYIEGHAE
jgi:hypothetical protein